MRWVLHCTFACFQFDCVRRCKRYAAQLYLFTTLQFAKDLKKKKQVKTKAHLPTAFFRQHLSSLYDYEARADCQVDQSNIFLFSFVP